MRCFWLFFIFSNVIFASGDDSCASSWDHHVKGVWRGVVKVVEIVVNKVEGDGKPFISAAVGVAGDLSYEMTKEYFCKKSTDSYNMLRSLTKKLAVNERWHQRFSILKEKQPEGHVDPAELVRKMTDVGELFFNGTKVLSYQLTAGQVIDVLFFTRRLSLDNWLKDFVFRSSTLLAKCMLFNGVPKWISVGFSAHVGMSTRTLYEDLQKDYTWRELLQNNWFAVSWLVIAEGYSVYNFLQTVVTLGWGGTFSLLFGVAAANPVAVLTMGLGTGLLFWYEYGYDKPKDNVFSND